MAATRSRPRGGGTARASAAPRLAKVPNAPTQIGELPRALAPIDDAMDSPLALARYQSPLRYPGAKSGLANSIGTLVESATASPLIRRVELFVEPFAGGASTALRLAGSGIVDRILLADADPLVAAFWQVAASQTEDFVDRVTEEHRRYVEPGGSEALGRWDYWRAWKPRAGQSPRTARFETAVKCLFLNRTTFSGILHGRAGPLGGRRQSSPYTIGCRFNMVAIGERVRFVGELYDTNRLVDVWCKDWSETLADVPEWYPSLVPDRVVAYLDPPYIEKSEKLYQRSFDPAGGYAAGSVVDLDWQDRMMHYRLAEHLHRRMRFRWILSYDADPLLVSDPGLYAASRMSPSADDKAMLDVREWRISKRLVSLRYTAAARAPRGPVDELLLTTLPPATIPLDREFRRVPRRFRVRVN